MLLPKGLKGTGIERLIGISLAEVYERVGKCVIWSDKKAQEGEQMYFVAGIKSRKRSGCMIYQKF